MAYVSVGGSVLGQGNMLGNTAGQQGSGMPIPNQIAPSSINPKAFSNPQAIAGIYGQANPGTFTRSVGNQMGQLAGQIADQPVPVPSAIQDESQITPNQGFNNI